MKDRKITFRADPPLFDGIKAMAEKRGMTMSDYVRMMASLELIGRPSEISKPVLLELKNTLADMDQFASRDPTEQVALLRRSIDAIATAKKANDEAFKWIFAVASGLEAYSRADGKCLKDQP